MSGRGKLPPEVREALVALRQGLAKVYGPRLAQLYLYGSYARGEAQEATSDVDVLIVLEGDAQPAEEMERIGRLVSDIALQYDLLLSVYPVPARWFARRQSPFFIQVREEAIPV
jgi:predicted nucleotidyltransferase